VAVAAGVVSLSALLALAGGPSVGSAAAQTGCEAFVEDRAGRLDPAAENRIAAGVLLLREAGARGYVRLLDDTAAGIDDWFEDALAGCPSWQDADGRRAPDLLVLAVSLGDRRTGTYYGEGLTADLDDRWPGVHEAMAELLRGGQHEVALLTGVRAYAALLGGEAGPAQPVAQQVPDPAGGGLPSGLPELIVVGVVGVSLAGAFALNRRHGSGGGTWAADTDRWSDSGGGWSGGDGGGGDSGGGGDGGGGSSGW
jgi:uncharacterized protein